MELIKTKNIRILVVNGEYMIKNVLANESSFKVLSVFADDINCEVKPYKTIAYSRFRKWVKKLTTWLKK